MRKTKIVATISNTEKSFLQSLIDAGVDVLRLNTAHMSQEDALHMVTSIREVSDRIAILLDTKGPEVRTGQIDDPMHIVSGMEIRIRSDPVVVRDSGVLWVSYPGFIADVPIGATILLDDGLIGLRVITKTDDEMVCVAQNDGVLKSRKSVNVPNVRMRLSSVSQKDEAFLRFAVEHGVDFIAHSFVRGKQDILDVQKIIDQFGGHCKIIAKIENREGVEHLDEILDVAFGVMVARGDLAVEVPMHEVPLLQKRIIKACVAKGKPVITATQMLHSMMEYPRPTRAEVSDVANAVLDGTDAVMLSGETASGKYPLEAVQMMARVAESAEAQIVGSAFTVSDSPSTYLARAAVVATRELPIRALVVPTISGRSARTVAAHRPTVPVFALCCDSQVAREMQLSFGVVPSVLSQCMSRRELIVGALELLCAEKFLMVDDVVALVVGAPGKDSRATVLEIDTVARALETNRL